MKLLATTAGYSVRNGYRNMAGVEGLPPSGCAVCREGDGLHSRPREGEGSRDQGRRWSTAGHAQRTPRCVLARSQADRAEQAAGVQSRGGQRLGEGCESERHVCTRAFLASRARERDAKIVTGYDLLGSCVPGSLMVVRLVLRCVRPGATASGNRNCDSVFNCESCGTLTIWA